MILMGCIWIFQTLRPFLEQYLFTIANFVVLLLLIANFVVDSFTIPLTPPASCGGA